MRFHTVYDYKPRKGMFIQKLIDGELEYVTNHYRDFIHMDDLCDAIELLIRSTYTGTAHIGTGVPFRIPDFAENLSIPFQIFPNERQWTCANMDKMKSLGLNPSIVSKNS